VALSDGFRTFNVVAARGTSDWCGQGFLDSVLLFGSRLVGETLFGVEDKGEDLLPITQDLAP